MKCSIGTTVILMYVLINVCSGIIYYNAYTTIGTVIGKIESLVYKGIPLQYVTYLGIPYASNPTDWFRFSKSTLRDSFKTPFNATYFRPPCLQTGSKRTSHVTSEDCLFLNIYAPVESTINPKRKYPVIIYLHGGTFTVGASSDVAPEILTVTGDIIVITVNYRLGIFGFLSSGDDLARGNFGLWDQQLAIRWVRYNIASFGGDVDKITLMGHEAGAASAILHAFYAGNRGLFQRVIAMSGTSLSPWALHGANVKDIAEKLECYNTDPVYYFSLEPYIECIRHKSIQDILRIQPDIQHLGPTVDGDFLIAHPLQIIESNKNKTFEDTLNFFRSLDIITGITSSDGIDVMKRLFSTEFKQTNLASLSLKSDEFEQIVIPDILQPVIENHELFINNTMDTFTMNNVKYSVMFQYTNWSDPENNASMRDNLLALSTDANFVVPAVRIADTHSYTNYNASTYVFLFDHKPGYKSHQPTWLPGAGHGSELLPAFGFSAPMMKAEGLARMGVSYGEFNLSQNMMLWISNFAKTGDPNEPFPLLSNGTPFRWPEYSDERPYLRFTTNMTAETSLRTRFGEPATSFWTTLIPVLLESSRPKPGGGIALKETYFTAFRIGAEKIETVIVSLILTICALLIVIIIAAVCACRYIS